MCIFQGSAHVSSTKILAAALKDGRQLTVYSNVIALKEEEKEQPSKRPRQKEGAASGAQRSTPAMILPFPIGPIEFVNLEKYEDIFDDLYRATHHQSLGKGPGRAPAVHDVGSYRVSVAVTASDLAAIDAEFVLDDAVRDLVGKRYPVGFSFLVCRLRPNAKYHPLGYVHCPRPADGGLFVPTYHFHGDADGHVDWDHFIYTNGTIDALSPLHLRHELSRDVSPDDTQCGLNRDLLGPALYDQLRSFNGSCCYRICIGRGAPNCDLVVRV